MKSNKPKHISYKRLQRDVKKQLQQGVGTKSQIALKMQYEVSKQEHLVERKKRLEKEKQMKFVLKQQKKKEKHRDISSLCFLINKIVIYDS